ncbi:MAG: type III-A CRISPR-associated RAMP protein Csm3 [Clostridiales bacterium]|nr:type III-A CRISPR-associated RAMP protein Csm3 [Clostridiales bacterium]
MYAKIHITGILETVTGMHIGGSSVFAAIGAVDSPVIKDARTNLPMIPGSSLKGKMRALLAKTYNEAPVSLPDDDDKRLTRVFGTAKKGQVKRSRVLISDMMLCNAEQLREQGLQALTEIKFENSINRLSAVANPRQIERVVRGAEFALDLIYEAEVEDEILEDFEVLTQGMKLLQYDYLGGSGTRGYGKVQFKELLAETVVGEVSDVILDRCNVMLKGV